VRVCVMRQQTPLVLACSNSVTVSKTSLVHFLKFKSKDVAALLRKCAHLGMCLHSLVQALPQLMRYQSVDVMWTCSVPQVCLDTAQQVQHMQKLLHRPHAKCQQVRAGSAWFGRVTVPSDCPTWVPSWSRSLHACITHAHAPP